MAETFFDDVVFPQTISLYAFKGKVSRKSRRLLTDNGFQSRLALWATSLRSYDAGLVPRPLSQWLAIEALYEAVMGPVVGFKLIDPKDSACSIAEGTFAATPTPNVWSFQKRYRVASRSVYRAISKPMPGARFYLGMAEIVPTAVDYPAGLMTFSNGGAINPNDLSWMGRFWVPVQFDSDDLDWETVDRALGELLISGASVPIIELRMAGAGYRPPDNATSPATGSPAPGPTPPPGPSATTIVLLSGPSNGNVGQASAPFHFGLDGTPAGPVHVTLLGSGSGGTEGSWTPATITLSSASANATATYTAGSAGTKSLSRTNDAGLGNGATVSYTAAVVTSPPPAGGDTTSATIAPSTQSAQAGNSVSFTLTLDVTPNPGPLSFNVTSSDPNDAIVPNFLSYSGGDPVQKTFGVMTSSAIGTHTITATSTSTPAIVSNGATISVTAAPAPTPPGAPIPLTSGQAVNWTTSGSTPIDYTITVPSGKTNLHIESTGDVSAVIAYKFGQPVDVATNTADGAYQNPGSIDATPVSVGTYYVQVYPLNPNVSGTLKATVT